MYCVGMVDLEWYLYVYNVSSRSSLPVHDGFESAGIQYPGVMIFNISLIASAFDQENLLRIHDLQSGSKLVRMMDLPTIHRRGKNLHDRCHDSARVRHMSKFCQVYTWSGKVNVGGEVGVILDGS